MNPMMNNMNMNNGMGGMNGMNGMGGLNGMGGMGMNPMMMGGNGMGGMGMNQMMMGGNGMGGMGMNQMGMNQMGMNPMMMGGGMNMQNNMTPEQLKQWKQQLRYQGYLMGKQMAMERSKKAQGSAPATTTNNDTAQANATGELSIKFKKGGDTKVIKMNANCMIAELLNEYFDKTKNQGPFKYNGKVLAVDDCSTLGDNGMKSGDEIIVG